MKAQLMWKDLFAVTVDMIRNNFVGYVIRRNKTTTTMKLTAIRPLSFCDDYDDDDDAGNGSSDHEDY